MPKQADPAVRTALVQVAADLLARRQPVTVRAVAQGAGTTTMALYTHFGGMAGLWRAVRQEGFTLLAGRLARVERTDDPVRDLVALGAAYVAHALVHPNLYRVMFDAAFDLEDPEAADATFAPLVEGVARAGAAGRFAPDVDAAGLATRFWATGHGMVSLVLTGVLPAAALDDHVPAVAAALFTAAGDETGRCRRSVAAGWHPPPAPGEA